MNTSTKEKEAAPTLLEPRIDHWVRKIRDFEASGQEEKAKVDELLSEGYRIFFDILGSLAETGTISSETADGAREIRLFKSDKRLRGFDQDLFGKDLLPSDYYWLVAVFHYAKLWDRTEMASVRLRSAQPFFDENKTIKIRVEQPVEPLKHLGPEEYMIVEDTKAAIVRRHSGGELDKGDHSKDLREYSALQILQLKVSLAHIYAEEIKRK